MPKSIYDSMSIAFTVPPEVQLPNGNAYTLRVQLPTTKSLFIQMRFGDTVLSSGTAFLVAPHTQGHCALVTNRHNVTGKNQDTGQCLSKTGGIPDNIVIYFHKEPLELGAWKPICLPLYKDNGDPWWVEHPRLGSAADVVALNLSWGSDVHKLPYYTETNLDRQGLIVNPGEPVSVIGFPFGLSSAGKLPIWATGFLAQELSLITPENPVFLIDCRTRQGQSGSAVIAYRPDIQRRLVNGGEAIQLGNGVGWEFLGIYSGRVNPDSDLGKVWHVSAIEEVLSAAEAAMNKGKGDATPPQKDPGNLSILRDSDEPPHL